MMRAPEHQKIPATWIPNIGEWILIPKLFSPGEYELAQVTYRTKNSEGNEIWLWSDDRKFRLEHCKPATRDHLRFEYERLLELTAIVGELLDSMEAA